MSVMFRSRVTVAASAAVSHSVFAAQNASTVTRGFATAAVGTSRNHRVVVVGGGSAGLTVSHQLLRTGKFSQDDIAVVDPAIWHHSSIT